MILISTILDYLAALRAATPEGPIAVDLSVDVPLVLRRRSRTTKAALPQDLRGVRSQSTVRAELMARYIRPPEAGPPKDGEPTTEGDILVGQHVGKLWRGLGESCGLSCVRHRCTGAVYLAYKPVLRADGEIVRRDLVVVDAWGNPLDEVRHLALAEYLPATKPKSKLANAWRVVALEHVLGIRCRNLEYRAPARRRVDSAGG